MSSVPTVAPSSTTASTTYEVSARRDGLETPTGRVMAVAAAVGPVLLAAASVAWLAGDDYAEVRGILTFWAFPALLLAGLGLVARFGEQAPRARAVLTTTLAIAAVAGGAFATEVNMVEHFGVERLIDEQTPSAMLALGLPGLLLPVSLVATGILSYQLGTMPRLQAGLLVVGGAMFPLSRIPEVPGLALAADLVLLAALVPVALRASRR